MGTCIYFCSQPQEDLFKLHSILPAESPRWKTILYAIFKQDDIKQTRVSSTSPLIYSDYMYQIFKVIFRACYVPHIFTSKQIMQY